MIEFIKAATPSDWRDLTRLRMVTEKTMKASGRWCSRPGVSSR